MVYNETKVVAKYIKVSQSGEFQKKGAGKMLIGEYKHSIDAKGRVIMPAKFREDIGDTFYVTKGADNCLKAYAKEGWEEFMAKVAALPDSDPNARSYKRSVLASSIECELDKQGRILISENLRNHASLKKEVTIIGVSAYIEIWDTEEWNKYSDTSVGLVEELSAYGL